MYSFFFFFAGVIIMFANVFTHTQPFNKKKTQTAQTKSSDVETREVCLFARIQHTNRKPEATEEEKINNISILRDAEVKPEVMGCKFRVFFIPSFCRESAHYL